MPIYEFYCPDNNTLYSFLAKSLRFQDKTPRCPANDTYRMEKRISQFAFISNAGEEGEDPMDDMDEAKMERVMAELERDMAGFDEENPDPRHMAHLMRKMSYLSGEKLPAEMQEMVSRLEKGEDPEALEAEYGDAFDAMGEEGESGDVGRLKRLQRQLFGPKRDPELYDMSDYCA